MSNWGGGGGGGEVRWQGGWGGGGGPEGVITNFSPSLISKSPPFRLH